MSCVLLLASSDFLLVLPAALQLCCVRHVQHGRRLPMRLVPGTSTSQELPAHSWTCPGRRLSQRAGTWSSTNPIRTA